MLDIRPPRGGPLGAETQFSVSLTMGGITALSSVDTEPIVMNKDRTDPHIFEVRAENVNVSMNSGEEIRLSIQVRHECAVSGTLWWGTYDARTGVIFDGHMIEAELDVVVDQNRMARIELTPFSPWGASDFSAQSIELVGPVPWSDMRHDKHDEDVWVDHFEIPDGFSKGRIQQDRPNLDNGQAPCSWELHVGCLHGANRPGPGETCHSWVLLRFNVPEDTPPILGSFAAVASVFLGLLAWAGASMRGSQLPLPAYGSVLLLALACTGTAIGLPEIDSDNYREGSAAPSFILLSHDPDSGAKSYRTAGRIRRGSPRSVHSWVPNAERQMDDFDSASRCSRWRGPSASFVQIATGEDVKAYNLDDFSLELNGSGPCSWMTGRWATPSRAGPLTRCS